MIEAVFLTVITIFFILFFTWGFRNLPKENRQILASIPIYKEDNGSWKGVNITFYGLLVSVSYIIAVSFLFILLGSISVPLYAVFLITVPILVVCVISSRLVARIVEKKLYNFTIEGASFVGIIIAPFVIWGINIIVGIKLNFYIPFVPTLAALFIAYSFGEGAGRLACISFGCCYGKSLSKCHPILRKIFKKYYLNFRGDIKKISYEGNLCGVKVLPIQAITSVVCIITGIIGMVLFFNSYYMASFIFVLIVTQIWRLVSEILRADYRGNRKISIYQIMAVISIAYSILISYILPASPQVLSNIFLGLKQFWDPAIILFLILLWLAIFIYTGKSMVTGSNITFFLHKSRI